MAETARFSGFCRLPDGRVVELQRLIDGCCRVIAGRSEAGWRDDVGWTYATVPAALRALAGWVERFDELPEPEGWLERWQEQEAGKAER